MRHAGYVALVPGVALTTLGLVLIGGWVGYSLAFLNLALVLAALFAISRLREEKR